MIALDHTPHIIKQIVQFEVASLTTNIMLEASSIGLSNPNMAQLFMNMPYKVFKLF
jgi:hypothetical protein